MITTLISFILTYNNKNANTKDITTQKKNNQFHTTQPDYECICGQLYNIFNRNKKKTGSFVSDFEDLTT